MNNKNPRLELLSERKLIGTRKTMSFADNQTSALWKGFMSRLNGIHDKIGANLYSVQNYPADFFNPFSPDRDFEKCAAIAVSDTKALPTGMEIFTLPAGLYAVFQYKGLPEDAGPTFEYIIGKWVPESDYELDDRPHFELLGEKYNNNDPESEEEIYVPIRPKDRNKQAVKVFDEYADQYQQKFMNVDLYQESLDLFCNHVKKNGTVLELACGPGNITKYILDKRADLRILATDLAPKMIALAKDNNPLAEFRLMDCRSVKTLGQEYDAIMCGFCLPYLTKNESVALISDIASTLNTGGICYLSTMEDDYSKSGPKKSSDGKSELFMHYHQADYLVDALNAGGLEILELRRQEFPSSEPEKTVDLIIIARKN